MKKLIFFALAVCFSVFGSEPSKKEAYYKNLEELRNSERALDAKIAEAESLYESMKETVAVIAGDTSERDRVGQLIEKLKKEKEEVVSKIKTLILSQFYLKKNPPAGAFLASLTKK